tara:strand:- start:76 stop:918 length:843 start_codon:yes stop_codon:yes gene_type:complete
MFILIVTQSLVVFEIFEPNYYIDLVEYICVLSFMPAFLTFIKDFLDEINSKEKELLEEVIKKNTYLEHAAKIIRHDMHSGINTYIPRGIRSLERRLNNDVIKNLKLESPMRLLNEGLLHTQQVYRGVFEFTNLVRQDTSLQTEHVDIQQALLKYLKRTSYKDQVLIDSMPIISVNESLFCTAIDNLIRNGLKYNDSKTKWVKIKMIESKKIGIIDNGRGMSDEQFRKMMKPYVRARCQKESGSGLGLNICVAILKEHGFKVSVQKLEKGTMIVIDIDRGS